MTFSTISTLCLILSSFSILARSQPQHHDDAWNDANSTLWSTCRCPAARPDFLRDSSSHSTPAARIASLISVHNRLTLADAAYLLKALMETSLRGNAAVVLIHVDKRVGVASEDRDDAFENKQEEGDEKKKKKYLYFHSPLKRYVDACLSSVCTAHNDDDNATVLEVHSHFAPEWSKWSMNDLTIWAMDYLLHHSRFHNTDTKKWDVFINLSGDTLPVVSAHRISTLFAKEGGPLGDTNFVTSSSCVTGLLPTSIYHFPKGWMKRAHYFQHDIPKQLTYVDAASGELRQHVNVTIYFGSQWMALTYQFVDYVIRSMEHPNGLGNVLMDMLTETEVLMTDETFFATILMNSPTFKDTLPKLNADGALRTYPTLKHLRYERMDENNPDPWGKYTSSDPLYDIPPKFSNVTDGEGPAKPWGPYFLGVYDLGAIRDSGALFVRKVSAAVDENLIRLLPVERSEEDRTEWEMLPDFRWPKLGVDVHDPFVWKASARKKKRAVKQFGFVA